MNEINTNSQSVGIWRAHVPATLRRNESSLTVTQEVACSIAVAPKASAVPSTTGKNWFREMRNRFCNRAPPRNVEPHRVDGRTRCRSVRDVESRRDRHQPQRHKQHPRADRGGREERRAVRECAGKAIALRAVLRMKTAVAPLGREIDEIRARMVNNL